MQPAPRKHYYHPPFSFNPKLPRDDNDTLDLGAQDLNI